MMGTLAAFLAVSAVRSKLGVIIDAAFKALTGDVDKMISAVMDVKAQVDSAVGEDSSTKISFDSEEDSGGAGQAIAAAWESVKGLVWGLVEKVVGATGAEAVAQVAGPVMWIKRLGEILKGVIGGSAWVCEQIIAALRRSSLKIQLSNNQQAKGSGSKLSLSKGSPSEATA